MTGIGESIAYVGLLTLFCLGLVGLTTFIGLWRSPLLRGRNLIVRLAVMLSGAFAGIWVFILLLRLEGHGLLRATPWACGVLLLYFATTSRSFKTFLRGLF